MQSTRVLLQQRQPLIKFLGKRKVPTKIDHTPKPHPVSPSHALPNSFASYRANAQQHGPLGGNKTQSSSSSSPSVSASAPKSSIAGSGARSGKSLGSVEPAQGEYFDRSELPKRFQRTGWSAEEIEAVESGGASMW